MARIHTVVAALFIVLAIAMTWPLAQNLDRAVSDPGDPFFTSWVLDWDWYATVHRLPLFDAKIFYPDRYALAFSEHMYGVAVLLFPLFFLGVPVLTIHNVAIILAFAANGYALFLLARWITGSVSSGIIGGALYAFVGYRFLHLPHLHFLWSMWLPLLLLTLLIYAREPNGRHAALFGVCFLMNALSTLHWFAFGAIAVAATAILLSFFVPREVRFRHWTGLAIAIGVAVLLTIPFTWPYVTVGKLYGIQRLYSDAIRNSAEWSDWLVPVPQSQLYGRFSRIGAEERALFPGFVAFGLAAVALLSRPWKEPAENAHQRRLDHRWPASLIRTVDACIVLSTVAAMLGRMCGHVSLAGGLISYDGAATPLVLLTVLIIIRVSIRSPKIAPAPIESTRKLSDASQLTLGALCGALWIVIGAAGARGLRGFFHTFLFEHIAPFRGIRMPVRWVMIAYVGLAIFVAIGTSRLIRNRGTTARIGICTVILLALLIELRAAPIRWCLLPLEPRPAYDWLARIPIRGAILEIPMQQYFAYEYLWRATLHRKPLINGVSSYIPRDYERLQSLYEQEPIDAGFISSLVTRHCSLIVVHEGALRERAPGVREWLRREVGKGKLLAVRRFDAGTRGDYVFAVTQIEPTAAAWRAPERPDPSGRTPLQNVATFLATGDWTYSGQQFANVDEAPIGTIHGALTIRGWALAPEGVSRVNLRFANGRIVVPATFYDRPDVTAKLPWYPKVRHAGFEANFAKPFRAIHGASDMQVEVVDGAGRARRNPPYWFHWYGALSSVPVWKQAELDALLARLGADAVRAHDRLVSGSAAIQDFVPRLVTHPLIETDFEFLDRALTILLGEVPQPLFSRCLKMLGDGSSREQVLAEVLQTPEFAKKYLLDGRITIREKLTTDP